MKLLFLKYKNYLIVILTILSLGFLLFNKKTPPIPQITVYAPKNLSQGIDLRASPNYALDNPSAFDELSIKSSPPINFKLEILNQNAIIATHSLAFQPATTYAVTLYWKDQIILTHSFTTIKSQEDPLLIQNMKDELARDYPLAQKLPLNTTQYRVVYSAPLTLEISIKNPNLTSAEIIEEVKSWVAQNGGDSSAHKYVIAP